MRRCCLNSWVVISLRSASSIGLLQGLEDNPESQRHLLQAGAFLLLVQSSVFKELLCSFCVSCLVFFCSDSFSNVVLTSLLCLMCRVARGSQFRPPTLDLVCWGVCQPLPLKLAGATSVSVRLNILSSYTLVC
ncbi:hypothetical protein F2Q69_00051300 [Brassica cretica]|uniref:Uncharacterized protein n=1 Tax=Brassica cretica TaxID=69181 RepID=A0A8S9PTW0_BRACR|nr:hypothetical protein F2Q69_00051300 [Brassica cretica]